MSNANYLRETTDLVKQIETRFLELGSRLFRIQREELWRGEYELFMEYIDASGLSRPFASKLTTIYRIYVVDNRVALKQLAEAGYSKLWSAIPLLVSQDAETVVAKARLLTSAEIAEEVREEKHGECKHEEQIKICSGCKKRIYE